ncbi:MAG: PspC domain-containing protein [Pseudomonadota bacterium]|nr:PspC domain-containing protein [Pseudomonadota bacterium]
MTRRFTLDRANGKLMGVCAGLSRSFDIDATLLRVGAVLSLFVLGPLAVLLYLVAGWVAPDA